MSRGRGGREVATSPTVDLAGLAGDAKDRTTFSHTVTYRAPCRALFRVFTDAFELTRLTRSPARVEARPGGALSLMDGVIQGQFTEVEEPSRLVIKWRSRDWPVQCYSMVTLTFSAPDDDDDECRVELTQTDVPRFDRFGNRCEESNSSGWRSRIFDGITKCIGIGYVDD